MSEQLFCDNCGKLNWSRWAETCECRHPKFIHGEHIDYLEAKKRGDKTMSKKNDAGSVSITLDMESDKMQRQLRAITKHTEALADELRDIDQDECPECGSSNLEVTKAYANSKLIETIISCNKCDWNNLKG